MDKLRQLWYSLNLKTRDKLTRAAKTAGQTFIAALPLSLIIGADYAAAKAAIVSAAAAAVSAGWNTLFPPSTGEAILVPVFPGDILPPKE